MSTISAGFSEDRSLSERMAERGHLRIQAVSVRQGQSDERSFEDFKEIQVNDLTSSGKIPITIRRCFNGHE